MNHRVRAFLALAVIALAGSCMSKDSPTGVDAASGPAGVLFQPSVIPSAANASALPIDRIRAIAVRDADDGVLVDSAFTVDPADTAWTITLPVHLPSSPTTARVYIYLMNAGTVGPGAVQFSGMTAPLELRGGETTLAEDFPLVRGPLDNLLVTGVTISTSAPSVPVGLTTTLAAAVTTSSPTATPVTFWTSLDTTVVRMSGSVATGVAVGTADVVASAGALADTVTVTVLPRVASVVVSPDSADVMAGATATYTAATYDGGGNLLTGRPVTWSTANASVATVNASTGVVTGVAAGTTTVRATSEAEYDDAIVVVTAPAGGTGGQNSWIATSGNWSTPANWSLGRVPIPEDTVLISQGGGYTVTLDADATVAAMTLAGVTDVVTLDVNDFTLSVTGTVQLAALGNIEINNGTINADAIQNDGSIRSTGTSTFTTHGITNNGLVTAATGSTMSAGHTSGIAFENYGSVALEAGAELTVTIGNFRFWSGSVTGPGTLHMQPNTAFVLFADLTIDGPWLNLEGTGIVAAGGRRRLTVGPTSQFWVGSFAGAGAGVGAVVTNNGSMVAYGPNTNFGDSLYIGASAGLFVGDAADSKVVTGAVDNSGTISMGGSGTASFGPGGAGSLQILNRVGAIVDILPGGNRVLNGRLNNQGSMVVGAPTVLQNRDASDVPVAASHVNTGLITLSSGDLTVELGGTGPVLDNQGTIEVNSGTTLAVVNLSDGQIINAGSGVIRGTGTIDFTAGNPVGVNNGTVSPGFSPGALGWTGSFPMGTTGAIAIELGGTTPGTGYDQLNVGNDLTLSGNGSLVVQTINGFVPKAGDSFAVLTYGSRTGTFGSVTLPTIPGVTLDTTWIAGASRDTLFLVATATGPATVNEWVSAVDGNWSDPGNWSLDAVPVAGDSVLIQQDGDYTITIDQNAEARSIYVGGGSGVQTLLNDGWSITVSEGIDIGSQGTLSIPTGGSLDGSGTITNRGIVQIGGSVINQLAVNNLGNFLVNDGAGLTQNATVTNAGVFVVSADASPTTIVAILGGLTNTGTIALEDVSTSLPLPDLRVNSGTLVNEAGGLIYTTGLGDRGAFLRAPIDNRGTMVASTGLPLGITPTVGVVHANTGTIIGNSRIAFTNVDAFTNSGSIDGSQDIDVTLTGNGAGFINANSGTITTGVTSTIVGGNVANVVGGLITVADGTLTLGGSSNVTVSDGDIEIAANATLIPYGDVTLSAGGTLGGSGTMDNSNTTAGELAGDVLPGGAGQVGTLSWIDDYIPSSTSQLLIELAGTSPGQYDQLSIVTQSDASLTFDGALVVSTLGYTPQPGDTFPVLLFDERTAPFASVTLPTVSGALLDTVWSANAGLANRDTLYVVAKPLPLALSSDRAGVGDRDIWLTTKDGATSLPLTSTADNDEGPRWSPDGSQIVFTRRPSSGAASEVWTMDADGANATRRTPGTQPDSEPDWSSDGTRIVYTHDGGTSLDLWYMNKDGSGQTELTVEPGFDESQPDWSPTADSIVYVHNLQGNDDIWVMDFTNPNFATAITVDVGQNRQPQYSPDGSQIVFASDRTGNFEIWVMNRDGSSPQQLTNDAGDDGFPTWSPDGSQIYFASDRTGNLEIWVMAEDGSSPTQVSNDPGADDAPSVLY